jgi:hypothetical protein
MLVEVVKRLDNVDIFEVSPRLRPLNRVDQSDR